ncbi:unnamed protein product [Closterium sp. NIES-53]
MATLSVLTFDPEGRPIEFDSWLDDLQLYLLSDSRDGVSLFYLTSGASLAPPDIADSATRSQWLTRDAAARLVKRASEEEERLWRERRWEATTEAAEARAQERLTQRHGLYFSSRADWSNLLEFLETGTRVTFIG